LETETCETQTQLSANRLLELPPRKGIASRAGMAGLQHQHAASMIEQFNIERRQFWTIE